MGLMKKIFGGSTNGAGAAVEPPQPPEGQSHSQSQSQSQKATEQAKARDTRRELVQVVLRDTMRKHGVPSDWIDCRVLSVMNRQHKAGIHVQFLVRKGDEQLLNYVHAFQESFWEEILKFQPQAREWLFSVGWQFYGKAVRGFAPMPGPGAWADEPGGQTEAAETQPAHQDAEDLASDLQALYAIRDAAISQPAGAAQSSGAKRPRGPGQR